MSIVVGNAIDETGKALSGISMIAKNGMGKLLKWWSDLDDLPLREVFEKISKAAGDERGMLNIFGGGAHEMTLQPVTAFLAQLLWRTALGKTLSTHARIQMALPNRLFTAEHADYVIQHGTRIVERMSGRIGYVMESRRIMPPTHNQTGLALVVLDTIEQTIISMMPKERFQTVPEMLAKIGRQYTAMPIRP